MAKRLLYIVFLLITIPCLSYANPMHCRLRRSALAFSIKLDSPAVFIDGADTLKVKKVNNETDDKNKVKELPKAKKQAKPQKLGTLPADSVDKKDKLKLRRQRRPEGLERPPEIPRRNNN